MKLLDHSRSCSLRLFIVLLSNSETNYMLIQGFLSKTIQIWNKFSFLNLKFIHQYFRNTNDISIKNIFKWV